MLKEFKVVVTKTIQETEFHPYVISFQGTFDVPGNFTDDELESSIKEEYKTIEKRVDSWMDERKNSS